ncbi:pollen-specific leucine-rich repeat extensin-like protein 2 [Hevea brasiliensis]|uniref:pollen-specific leucine-rich repeat extensin-like protein 2 n=1 Tax=Hevea brasiliensis TaxID=3981 RepID=UPI0025F9EEF3|nr:pollen-specific leucine-rich repeat extensin-like protein 2 [Hevea brasiliensis]
MGIPSSLPTNPNPSPSPPLPQSPPPQTLSLPQSPPPQTPPLPQGQTPTLIPPTPFSPQTEPQNETPIFETSFQEPMSEPAPTQTKSKFSKRTRSSLQIPSPAIQTPVPQSPLHSPLPATALAAPASSVDDIEEGSSYKNIEWQQTIYDPVQFWKDIAPFGGYYRQRTAKASRIVDHQHPEASGIAGPTTFAPAEPQTTTAPQFSADILSLLKSLESKIASFTVQPSIPSPDTIDILATLKSLEVKIDTMGQQQVN